MSVATMNKDDSGSKARILDVAERLFAMHSFAAVSVRQITSLAEVNLASVNYHFGSKDGLLKAVFTRRAHSLNRERIHQLQAVMADSNDKPKVEDVLRALLEPPIRWLFNKEQGFSVFIQFLARAEQEDNPELKEIFNQEIGHLKRFVSALCEALPDLSEEDVAWRLHFTLGTMHFTINHLERLRVLSNQSLACDNADAVIDRLVTFSAAGFQAM